MRQSALFTWMTSKERQARIQLAEAYRTNNTDLRKKAQALLTESETEDTARFLFAKAWHKNHGSRKVVYFMRAGSRIKIGYCGANIVERMKTLQTGCPDPLHLVGMLQGDFSLERDLHRRFIFSKTHGEWFDSNPELEDYINTRAQTGRPSDAIVERTKHNHAWTPVQGFMGRYTCSCGLKGQRSLVSGRIEILHPAKK
jgi:hypothetical protein